MFGNKNDNEEYEYIENYFDSDVYGKPADRTQNRPKELTPEYFEQLFTPYLDMGEQILYAFGGGSGGEPNPIDNEKTVSSMNKINKLRKVIIAMFILGFILVFFGNMVFERIGFLLIIPYMLMPIAGIGIVVAIIVWGASKTKTVDYAITDKRLIILAYGYMQQVIYECITDIKCTENGGTGTITMKTRAYGNEPSKGLFIMPGVKDAGRIAQILDEAVRNHMSGRYL